MKNEVLKSEFLNSLVKLRDSVNHPHSKGLIITVDSGDEEYNKEYVINKLMAMVPQDQMRYIKPNKKFMIKDFWANQPAKGHITLFDGSYISEFVKDKNPKLRDEASFFKYMMTMDNTDIIHIWCGKFMPTLPSDVITTTSLDKYEEMDRVLEAIKDKVVSLVGKPGDLINHKQMEYTFGEGDIAKLQNNDIKNKITYSSFEDYEYKKDELQRCIKRLHKEYIEKGLSVAIVFQGIDAAGKSSTIRRLVMPLYPGYYDVIPSKAPTKEELSHSYLWRYWNKFKDKGMVYIFDRSWYERLTAERFLKLNNDGWKTAPKEIEEFERELENNGIHVIKFWYNIDKDTQAARFNERKTNPLKQYKFSESDEETRKHWDEYIKIFASLLDCTKGWYLINSIDKLEARLNVLFIIEEEMRKFLSSQN